MCGLNFLIISIVIFVVKWHIKEVNMRRNPRIEIPWSCFTMLRDLNTRLLCILIFTKRLICLECKLLIELSQSVQLHLIFNSFFLITNTTMYLS